MEREYSLQTEEIHADPLVDFIFYSVFSIIFASVLAEATYLFGHFTGLMTETPSWLEFAGVTFNYACVLLCAVRRIENWWLGIVAVIFLGLLFFQQKLYASAALSIGFFLPVQIIGWWQWSKNLGSENNVNVKKLDVQGWISALICLLPAWAGVRLIDDLLGGSLSGWDSAIFTISIVAQVLLNCRFIETWYFWLVVNVLSVYVYGTTGLYVVALQYMLFLGNAVAGWQKWRKALTP